MNDNFHEMVFEKTHLSGVEEWYCPSCGRRFLVQWPPAYKMVIIEPGEKDIRHNLSKVSSRRRAPQATQTNEPEPVEDFRLIPWLVWMEKVDFVSRWDKSD
jgi:hypothetical protein